MNCIRIANIFYLLFTATILCASQIIVASDQQETPPSMSIGVQAVATIDWNKVGPGSPIPHLMPAVDADTAIEAGFAPQWLERALWPDRAHGVQLVASTTYKVPRDEEVSILAADRALQITKLQRLPEDTWVHEVSRKLRETARIHADAYVQRYTRVFCSSGGCICYWEHPTGANPSTQSAVKVIADLFRALEDDDGWGRTFGIKPTDVYRTFAAGYELATGNAASWQLVYIVRARSRGE